MLNSGFVLELELDLPGLRDLESRTPTRFCPTIDFANGLMGGIVHVTLRQLKKTSGG